MDGLTLRRGWIGRGGETGHVGEVWELEDDMAVRGLIKTITRHLGLVRLCGDCLTNYYEPEHTTDTYGRKQWVCRKCWYLYPNRYLEYTYCRLARFKFQKGRQNESK